MCVHLCVYLRIWRTYRDAHAVDQKFIYHALELTVKSSHTNRVLIVDIKSKANTMILKRSDVDFVVGDVNPTHTNNKTRLENTAWCSLH